MSCSSVLLEQFLGIEATKILTYDSNLSSDLVPPAPKTIFFKKYVPTQAAACSHPTCLNPIPVATALWPSKYCFPVRESSASYFCPLEDDLDFDEEVEEERRR